MKKFMKWGCLGSLVIFALLAIIVAYNGSDDSSANQNSQNDLAVLAPTTASSAQESPSQSRDNQPPTEESTPIPLPTNTPVPTPLPEPIVFSGTGTTVSPDFSATGPLLFVESSHVGERHAGIWLKDAATAENVELIMNDIGTVNDALIVPIDPGNYYYEVEGDGTWNISTKLPGHWLSEASSAPFTFSGTGSSITPKFMLADGRTIINLQHSGSRHFGVWIYNTNGTWRDLLANDVGNVTATVTIPGTSGEYAIDVSADGTWSIEIVQ